MSGFYGAPVSKALLMVSAGATLATFSAMNTQRFILDPSLPLQNQLFRIVTHSFVWGSPIQLMLGSSLLYNGRMQERLWGSRKFGFHVLFVYALTTSLQLTYLFATNWTVGSNHPGVLANGPYGFAFANLVQFYLDIPVVKHVQVMGIFVKDKTLTYLIALLMTVAFYPSTLVSVSVGLFAGYLYSLPWLGLHTLCIPKPLCSFFSVFSPIFASSRSTQPRLLQGDIYNRAGRSQVPTYL